MTLMPRNEGGKIDLSLYFSTARLANLPFRPRPTSRLAPSLLPKWSSIEHNSWMPGQHLKISPNLIWLAIFTANCRRRIKKIDRSSRNNISRSVSDAAIFTANCRRRMKKKSIYHLETTLAASLALPSLIVEIVKTLPSQLSQLYQWFGKNVKGGRVVLVPTI